MEFIHLIVDFFIKYATFETYALGAIITFIVFLFYAYVQMHKNKRDSLENDTFPFCFLSAGFWPITSIILSFWLLDIAFTFLSKVVASKSEA